MALDLEILISTMFRDNLDFLDGMFPCPHENYNLLIINQTQHNKLIDTTNLPGHIRVINIFERGLSKSRNLALKNAKADVLLLADEDVVFTNDFDKIILSSYEKFPHAVSLIFPLIDENGNKIGEYGNKTRIITDFSKIYSPQITLKRELFVKYDIEFNTEFGLGARYPDSENFIFLTDLHRAGAQIIYVNTNPIAKHPEKNTSWYLEKDEIFETRLMLIKKYKPVLLDFYFFKMLFFLLRKKKISWKNVRRKFEIYKRVKRA